MTLVCDILRGKAKRKYPIGDLNRRYLAVFSNTVVTRHMWLLKLKINLKKPKLQSITLAIFQVFNSHIWQEATVSHSVEKHFHHCRKQYWSRVQERRKDYIDINLGVV